MSKVGRGSHRLRKQLHITQRAGRVTGSVSRCCGCGRLPLPLLPLKGRFVPGDAMASTDDDGIEMNPQIANTAIRS
jgi:hypothetical protein